MSAVRVTAGMVALGAALVAGAPAMAWAPLPTVALGTDRVATCLRDAGDGRIAILGRLTRTTSSTDLLTVGRDALRRDGPATLGWLDDCAALATGPGPAQLAGAIRADAPAGSPQDLVTGGVDGPPALVARRTGSFVTDVAVARNAAGAVVVAWSETVAAPGWKTPQRVLAAVRPAGASRFAPPVMLAPARRAPAPAQVVAGIDGAGRATVAWTGPAARGQPDADPVAFVAEAGPEGTFGGAARVGTVLHDQEPALAVAGDGRALLAVPGERASAYERRTASAPFAPVGLGGEPGDLGYAEEVAVALGADGEAVIAWRASEVRVRAALRPPGGSFGAAKTVVPSPSGDASGGAWISFHGPRPTVPIDSEGPHLSAALGDGGTVALSWVTEGADERPPVARATHGTLTGGLEPARRLSSRCRATTGARALRRADGGLAVAWTDNAADLHRLPSAPAAGRLHAAVPDRATPAAAARAPRVRARVVGSRALRPLEPLRVRVRCPDGACDIRVAVAWPPRSKRFPFRSWSTGGAALPRGKARTLALGPDIPETVRRGQARLRVRVEACRPDGRASSVVELTPTVTLLPARPLPRVLDPRARRRGDAIVVTWRTDRPGGRAQFAVSTRRRWSRPPGAGDVVGVRGRDRTRFRASLHPRRPARVRRVWVVVHSAASSDSRTVPVRVT